MQVYPSYCLFQADVLVNSTTNDLQLDNGDLSETLLLAAGPELQARYFLLCTCQFTNSNPPCCGKVELHASS